MATITSVSAVPTSVSPGGGKSTITPIVTPSVSGVANVTVSVDGSSGSAAVSLHEPLSYSVNPADVGKPGIVVAVVDKGGGLAVGANGTFIFTAS